MLVRAMVPAGSRKVRRSLLRDRAILRAVRAASTSRLSASNFARASRAANASGVKTSRYSLSRLPRISKLRVPMNHPFAKCIANLSKSSGRGLHGLHRSAKSAQSAADGLFCAGDLLRQLYKLLYLRAELLTGAG